MPLSHQIRIAVPEIGQNMRNYVNALKGVGAEPVIVSVRREHTEKTAQQEYLDFSEFRAENYDGMLLPGGGDIEPRRYGQENNGSVYIDPALDTLQLCALDACVKNGVPVMGICRGHQLINVYFGGDLIQNIPTASQHAIYRLDQPDQRNVSHANHGSWIAQLYGTTFAHNSAHHQAVDRPGKGLVVDARCQEDGVVEAMHHESLPVISVQWHPERMCFDLSRPDTVDGSEVLQYFLNMCRGRRQVTTSEEGAML